MLATIALTAIIAFTGSPANRQEQQTPANHKSEAKPSSPDSTVIVVNAPPSRQQEKKTENQPNKLPPIWDIYWPTLALVILGSIGALIAIGTLRNIEQQTRDAKEAIILTHRPKLVVRNVVIPPLEILHRQTSVEDLLRAAELGKFHGSFQVANIGNTPATIVSISENILIGPLPMERQYSAIERAATSVLQAESPGK